MVQGGIWPCNKCRQYKLLELGPAETGDRYGRGNLTWIGRMLLLACVKPKI